MIDSSIRYVGSDSKSREYYVGKNEAGHPCLLVYRTPQAWGSACGQAGAFSVATQGVVAWLSTETFEGHRATDVIKDVIYIEE